MAQDLTDDEGGNSPLFNSSLETGVRAVVVLDAAFPRAFDLSQLTWLDHLVVHTADIGGPDSLHPDIPQRTGELHRTRDDREGDRIVRDRIRLIWTVPTYGGRRWWFVCPKTGQRTTKLFLPNGGWHFWSRQAYGLGYACQREDRFSR